MVSLEDCGGIGLSQNPQFVLGREGSALGISDHLRVWSRRTGRLGRDGGSFSLCIVNISAIPSRSEEQIPRVAQALNREAELIESAARELAK